MCQDNVPVFIQFHQIIFYPHIFLGRDAKNFFIACCDTCILCNRTDLEDAYSLSISKSASVRPESSGAFSKDR